MVKICFKRIGKKKYPVYRIIALDKQKDPWGNYLDNLGTYNPHTKELNLDEAKIKEWLDKGAQPSDTIYNLLVDKGVITGDKRRVSTLSKKRRGRLAKKEKAAKGASKEEAPADDSVIPTEMEESRSLDSARDDIEAPAEDVKPAEPAKEETKPEEK